MQEIYIYAHDHSGSTSKESYYFKRAYKYLQDFKRETRNLDNVHYLVWDSICKQRTLNEVEEIYESREGCGNTMPHEISNWIIKENLHTQNINLWLITDGEIHESSMLRCKSLNVRINFTNVILVTINEQKIDNSISFAFFNNDCKITIFEEVQNLYKRICLETSSYDFDTITSQNFLEKYDELSNYVISKYTVDYNKLNVDYAARANLEKDLMGFIDGLKKKRAQLLQELGYQTKSTALTGESCKLQKKDIIAVIKDLTFYKDLFNVQKPQKNLIIEKIDSLISYIHNSKKNSLSFSELKEQLHKQKFESRDLEELEEIPSTKFLQELVPAVQFMDSFSLCESNSPIICFTKIPYILDLIRTDNQHFIHIQDFAFALIHNEKFMVEKQYVCQIYDSGNFKTYLQITNELTFNFPIRDPNTRSDLFGGIIPYSFADQWNDFSISNIFFNGRKVNKTFYAMIFYVIWTKLEKVESVERSVVSQLKDYALYRLYNGESKLTFSSLPMEPKNIVPIPIALWYCIQLSSELFGEHEVLFKNEKMRAHAFSASTIKKILMFYHMDIDENFINKRAKTFIELVQMKTMNTFEKLKYVASSIFKTEDGFLLSVIDKPENIEKVRYIFDDLNSRVYFENVKQLDSIKDRFKLYYATSSIADYTICEQTCRPYYRIDGEIFYEKMMKKRLDKLEIVDNDIQPSPITDARNIDFSYILSICKMYIEFVHKYEKYPNLEEIKKRLLDEKSVYSVENQKKICLFPDNNLEIIQKIMTMYEPIKNKVLVSEFIERSIKSVSIVKREEMEKRDGF